jgi:hypothetical protein
MGYFFNIARNKNDFSEQNVVISGGAYSAVRCKNSFGILFVSLWKTCHRAGAIPDSVSESLIITS